MASGRPEFSGETSKIAKLNKVQTQAIQSLASTGSVSKIKEYLTSKKISFLAVTQTEAGINVFLPNSSITFNTQK